MSGRARKVRRCGSAAVALGVAATLLVPTQSASAAASSAAAVNQSVAITRFPEFASLRDSLDLKAPVVLHGRLSDATGAALGGAQVLLSAWPSREHVRAVDGFDTVPIARTVAGADGSFELRSTLTSVLAGLLGKEGLDVELSVVHSGRQWDYLSTVHPVREIGAWVRSLNSNIDVAASRKPNARTLLDIALPPAMGEKLPGDLLRAARLGVAGYAPDKNPFKGEHLFPGRWCTGYKKIWTELRVPETIAIASSRNGATALITYAEGAVTESSAGASVDGGLSFGVAGSRTHTSEIVTDYKPLPSRKADSAQRRYLIEVDHHTFEKRCMTDMQARTYKSLFKTAPDRTVGSDWQDMPKPRWKCDPRNEVGGGGHTRTKDARAYTYRRAFSFNPFQNLGVTFGGDTLSGYSKEIAIAYEFSSGKGLWCGHAGRPFDDDQMVQGYQP